MPDHLIQHRNTHRSERDIKIWSCRHTELQNTYWPELRLGLPLETQAAPYPVHSWHTVQTRQWSRTQRWRLGGHIPPSPPSSLSKPSSSSTSSSPARPTDIDMPAKKKNPTITLWKRKQPGQENLPASFLLSLFVFLLICDQPTGVIRTLIVVVAAVALGSHKVINPAANRNLITSIGLSKGRFHSRFVRILLINLNLTEPPWSSR